MKKVSYPFLLFSMFIILFTGCDKTESIDDSVGLQIGDIYEGGYIFQLNQDSTGLIANLEDSGEMRWYDALSAGNNSPQGYSDWYLPSKNELELMYENLGQGDYNDFIPGEGSFNSFGFKKSFYWSSTRHNQYPWAATVYFESGNTDYNWFVNDSRVRVIRAF